MKKIIAITVLVVMIGLEALATIPGPPRVVECPKCGEEKRLVSLISGNTIGATQWSDMYMKAPMLPKASKVQRCGKCGGYFLLSQAKERYADDNDFTFETGTLKYPEMKEALIQLEKDSLTREDEFALRLEFLHRYNDAYRGGAAFNDGTPRTESDHQLYLENINAMISLLDNTNTEEIPVIAELYREAADFEKCISILKDYSPNSDYVRSVANTIIKNAEVGNSKVFVISK